MNNVNERLVEDADIVAEVAASLGRLGPDQKLISLVAKAKDLRKDAQMDLAPEQEAALRAELNTTLTALSPITLGDLRQGWRPFDRNWRQMVRFIVVMSMCCFIVIAVGYYTLVYEKANAFLSSVTNMQTFHREELVSNIYYARTQGANEKQMSKVYIDYAKDVYGLRQQIMAEESYGFIATDINSSLLPFDLSINFIAMTPSAVIKWVEGWLLPSSLSYCKSLGKSRHACDPSGSGLLQKPSIGAGPETTPERLSCEPKTGEGETRSAAPDGIQPTSISPHCAIKAQADEVALIMKSLGLDFNPQAYKNYLPDIYHLKSNIDLLGKWVLPALYGAFGAMLFFMRHYVDPAVPHPPLGKLLYTLTLGGIAGVIVVWFWTPTPPTPNTIQVTSLGAFVVAFLVGFSTDVVFGMLDRFSKGLSDTLGKQGA